MKRLVSMILSVTIVMGVIFSVSVNSYAASPIENIYVNGEPIEFSDAERPYIQNDRTMVPLRVIAEALGATVYWFNDEKKIQMVRYDTTLRLFIGLPSLDIYKVETNEDGELEQNKVYTVTLDAPAFQGDETRDYRPFVPARAISEAFGADVNARFIDDDETKINRAMNVYILDDYDESAENIVSISDLYDNNSVPDTTLISTTGVISRIDSNYYLQDEDQPYKMIALTEIPEDVENFWTQQLEVSDNNPIGTKVKISGIIHLDGDRYSIPIWRGTTGLQALEYPSSSSARDNNLSDTENLFAD